MFPRALSLSSSRPVHAPPLLTFEPLAPRPTQDFISQLLVRDPALRLGGGEGGGGGVEQVKGHAFFTGIDWRLLVDKRYQPPFNPCRDQDIVSADNFESEFRDLEISPSEDLTPEGAEGGGPLGPGDAGYGRQTRLGSNTFAGFSYQPEVPARSHATPTPPPPPPRALAPRRF